MVVEKCLKRVKSTDTQRGVGDAILSVASIVRFRSGVVSVTIVASRGSYSLRPLRLSPRLISND